MFFITLLRNGFQKAMFRTILLETILFIYLLHKFV